MTDFSIAPNPAICHWQARKAGSVKKRYISTGGGGGGMRDGGTPKAEVGRKKAEGIKAGRAGGRESGRSPRCAGGASPITHDAGKELLTASPRKGSISPSPENRNARKDAVLHCCCPGAGSDRAERKGGTLKHTRSGVSSFHVPRSSLGK